MEIFGVSLPGLLSQLLLGLVNGSFYAILSLGLAVIFGLLNVINFAHGALFMTGALMTWMAMNYFGINYWWMLVLAPLVVGLFGVLIERLLLRWIYKLDHLYGLLLTLGLTLLIEGVFRSIYGVSGLGYDTPELLEGATNLGFMILPNYRAWVVVASVVVCLATWYVIEKTKLGAYLRAGTENPRLVEAFGINVPVMVTLTYAFGAALAAFALDVGALEVDGQRIALAVLDPAHLRAGAALVVIEVVEEEASPGPADLAQRLVVQSLHGRGQARQGQQGQRYTARVPGHLSSPCSGRRRRWARAPHRSAPRTARR